MGTGPLRHLVTPRPARVICTPSGVPHAIEITGRRRGVITIRDEWIVQDRWWTDRPVERHFFELVVEPGRVVTTFRDLRDREWYVYGPGNNLHGALGDAGP
jgi:hypothetical protein